MLTPRGEAAMEVEEEGSMANAIRPEDSVSSVGLTAEALKSHNKRLRGHKWDPEEKQEFAKSSRAALVSGPKPPDHPPPGFNVSKAAAVGNQKSKGTPAPKTGSAPKVVPPVKAAPAKAAPAKAPMMTPVAVAETEAKAPPLPPPGPPAPPLPPPPAPPGEVIPKTPPKASRSSEVSGLPRAFQPRATPSVAHSPAKSEAVPTTPMSEVRPEREPRFRVGDGGTLERVSGVAVSAAPTRSVMAISPAVPAEASATPTAVGLPARLEACIACHGSGTLPSRTNRRLFRLLTSRPTASSAAPSAVAGVEVEGQNSVSHVFIERGIGLFVELACSHFSVLSKACQESRASYIGVHDHLEKVSVQDRVISLVDEALKMMTTSASRERQLNREAKDQGLRLFLHVHVSLPCTGGSPLQNFSGGKFVKEHEKVFFMLLDAMEKVLSRLLKQEFTVSFELPNSNRYWSHPKLARVAESWFQFRSVVHACAMGIEGVPGLPIKKAFRIMSNSEELCKRLEKRFVCDCDFHASFNFSDFALSEKYSRKFARFFIRTLCVLALEGD